MSAGYRPFRSIHRVLGDPLRLRLLDALWVRPRSAKELAGWAGVPPDRLYYHLHQLERAGIVEVAGYRDLPGGKVERIYAVAGVEPPGDDASPEEVARFLGQALEATRADITQAYAAKSGGADREVMLYRGGARLSVERLRQLNDRFQELVKEAVENPDPNGIWTRIQFAFVDLQDRGTKPDEGDRR
jgi:DNA-binding transcriptional ArsR family regulator